ncbi:uncharacterized protein BO97DRAFT_394190 [Aspergillus homomorphus CBS 101889]|uniref:DUF4211 domain-containing protein n=1 Tax=Aspergillus homomorphus (strain CBS 101889) TaxID=1450537 RepID=A0A395HW49_ASPHC|nr:hypothetical protein BO97DRAFT_394190 [Aspergillus homomorphus CBS 101889]RAL10444.1 hypothetical protein BO97DRAFT_394190 [Aspergillus homomorphus CBS 101889]
MPRTYGKKKQTRLSFAPIGSSPAKNESTSDGERDRRATLRYSHPSRPDILTSRPRTDTASPTPFVNSRRSHRGGKPGPGQVEGSRAVRKSSRTKRKDRAKSPPPVVKIETSPEDEEESDLAEERKKRDSGSVRIKKHNRATSPAPVVTVETSSEEGEEESEEEQKLTRKSTRNKGSDRAKSAAVKAEEPSEDEANDSETLKVKQRPRKRSPGKDKAKSTRKSRPKRAATPEQDSESDIDLTRSARKRAAPMSPMSLKRKREEPSDSEASLQIISEESEGDIISRPRRKLRRGTVAQPVEENDDEDDDDVPRTPHRRARDQDDLDIEEDLQALEDSVVKKTRTRGRLANSARAQRQQHLEALRRRRAGEPESDEEESQAEPEEIEGEGESADENESEAESEIAAAIKHRSLNTNDDSDVESSIAGNDDLDRYEDDFVLQDEDDLLGAPSGLEDIPFEFTRHAYKQLKDYFQDAVEWMVHNQLNPAFPRSNPIYELAFSKLEDEVRGRTGSQLVSSVWNTGFCRALLARPQIEVTSYPTIENHPCDACKRSGHPASFDIKLYGKAYTLDTLEPLEDENSDDDDDVDDKQSDNEAKDGRERDRDGHVLPDENTRFYLGRHCKAKATLAHTLTHWRFHLNEWVADHLRRMGYLSDERILERSHWSQRKQTKYAIKAVETMVRDGEVKKLWRDFHLNLRAARESSSLG